jgi:cation:H+ antiporter
MFRPIPLPTFFQTGMIVLLSATGLHFLMISTLGRLPRWAGWLLLAAYAWFVYAGLVG